VALPPGLPRRYRRFWLRPWTRRAAASPGFRRWLKRHGYLTPHFRTAEAHSKDGAKVPRRYSFGCRQHAFRLERLRHALGDRPMPVTSWYRSPRHNAAVGGAPRSKHLQAIATDHSREWVARSGGTSRVVAHAKRLGFKGIGTYPGGYLHLDSRRGPLATWGAVRGAR
jgi:uncharacterized protein YcbK (DUF882 family)